MKRAAAVTLSLILLVSSLAWAGPGGKHAGGEGRKCRGEAAWKQGRAGDTDTTCPAGGERKHKRDRQRAYQQTQSQEQSQSSLNQ